VRKVRDGRVDLPHGFRALLEPRLRLRADVGYVAFKHGDALLQLLLLRGKHGDALTEALKAGICAKPQAHSTLSANERSDAGRNMNEIGG